MKQKPLILTVAILAIIVVCLFVWNKQDAEPATPCNSELVNLGRWNDMHYFLTDTCYVNRQAEPEEGAAGIEVLKAAYTDLSSWQTRRSQLEAGMRDAMLLPENTDKMGAPHVICTATLDCEGGYTIENLAIEVLQGVWVTGNLYRPTVIAEGAKIPAILSAQGHGATDLSPFSPRIAAPQRIMCAMLAKAGAVVYHYDQFARGESLLHMGGDAHNLPITQCIQTLSTMRVVDFLSGLSYVDTDRIGMTGCSGGGTQTFIGAALDQRIKVAVPVTQVSCFFPGGCACESGRPIHVMCDPASNNAEITAMIAPRALKVISAGGDWTRTTDQVEYPFIKRTYEFYGAGDLVENTHFPDEGHGFQQSKQRAMFDFMGKQLQLDLAAIQDENGEYDFECIPNLPDWKQVMVFPDGQLPEGHVTTPEQIYERMLANLQ